jgi:hypothetical protein
MTVAAALLLTHRASTNTVRLEAWSVIGTVIGIILFIRGFQMLRFKRLIMNTPASRIRSASMGLVEVSGIAKGDLTMPAGITGDACYYYRAIAWQLRQSGRNREWKQVASESLYVPFFVEDSTGRLLVDPQGADLDLQRNFKDEFDTSFLSSNRHRIPQNVAQFLARNGVSFNESTRVEEYCLKPDHPLFVFGTLRRNSNRVSSTPCPHVARGTSLHPQLNFLGTGGIPLQWIGLTSRASKIVRNSAAPTALARTASPAPASVWSEVSMDEAVIGRRGAPATQPAAAQTIAAPVALAEPDQPLHPTAPEAPRSPESDLDPSVSIGGGEGGDPFVISWRSQREVVRSLAWKSVLCIWGGPALSLVCLYFLALRFGWP